MRCTTTGAARVCTTFPSVKYCSALVVDAKPTSKKKQRIAVRLMLLLVEKRGSSQEESNGHASRDQMAGSRDLPGLDYQTAFVVRARHVRPPAHRIGIAGGAQIGPQATRCKFWQST
jgi:hypothetical protein